MPSHEGVVHVIDDDASVRESLSFLLEIENFEVFTYTSADAFLTALPPDIRGCIVTDIRMPGMNGIDVARRSECEVRGNLDGEPVSRRGDDCREDCRAQEFYLG
jgi:FixJ family two-component response regulator